MSNTIPSTPGVYAIINCVNHHTYIGSAVNLLRRKHEHFKDLEAGKHNNPHLQSAYDLYSASAFRFHILEHVHNVEDLLSREQFFLDTCNPEYNVVRIAGSTLGLTYTPEAKAKLSAATRGRKKSPEHIAKIKATKAAKRAAKLAEQQAFQPPLFG